PRREAMGRGRSGGSTLRARATRAPPPAGRAARSSPSWPRASPSSWAGARRRRRWRRRSASCPAPSPATPSAPEPHRPIVMTRFLLLLTLAAGAAGALHAQPTATAKYWVFFIDKGDGAARAPSFVVSERAAADRKSTRLNSSHVK